MKSCKTCLRGPDRSNHVACRDCDDDLSNYIATFDEPADYYPQCYGEYMIGPDATERSCAVCRRLAECRLNSVYTPKSIKLDQGKPRPSLVLSSMPRALLAVAEVGTYGAAKYTEDGWLAVERGLSRYTDAMDRHRLAEGIEPHDPESKLLHAAHTAWNALARLELMLR
jgi:hypothetical protein